MLLTQPLVAWCCTGHHLARQALVTAMPRVSGGSSPTTSKSADGPLRMLSTSSLRTLATLNRGSAARLGSTCAGAGAAGRVGGAAATLISGCFVSACGGGDGLMVAGKSGGAEFASAVASLAAGGDGGVAAATASAESWSRGGEPASAGGA